MLKYSSTRKEPTRFPFAAATIYMSRGRYFPETDIVIVIECTVYIRVEQRLHQDLLVRLQMMSTTAPGHLL